MSFRDVREALLCYHYDGIISEEEFLVLYEEYESTNLYFPYWEYDPFCLDNFDSSEARAEFRIDKDDIPLLAQALNIPDVFRCYQGTGNKSIINKSY